MLGRDGHDNSNGCERLLSDHHIDPRHSESFRLHLNVIVPPAHLVEAELAAITCCGIGHGLAVGFGQSDSRTHNRGAGRVKHRATDDS